jgi:hypothetical protein
MLYAISSNTKEETKMEKLKKTVMIISAVAILMMPVVSIAGDLEPSAAPAPTMKTLDQIPPTWSQTLPAAERFELVLDGTAVLDKETGLVWEKSPLTSTYQQINGADNYCCNLNLGGRKGWHVATVEQLLSLVDTSTSDPVKLPSGHPFTNVQQQGLYWSATVYPDNTYHWKVNFGSGAADPSPGPSFRAWCVRGGETNTGYTY